MAADASGIPRAFRLLQRLSQGMQFLLLVLVAVISILTLWWASLLHDGGWKGFWNAIGTGLLVSAAFGVAQALVTGRVTTELLRASIVSEVNLSLSQSNQAFFPTHDFPPSVEPDSAFNTLIMQDLNNSSVYWFRGVSGRYTAARLAGNRNVNLQCHLILPDPRVHNSVDGRAEYAFRHGLYHGLNIDQIRDKIHEDMAVGLVGLFAARHRCASLDLILTPMPLLDRYEIFRDSVWVTLFSDRDQGTKFPRTLRFSSSSVVYRSQEADCLQTRLHPAARCIDLSRRLGEADLPGLFAEVMGRTASADELNELKARFEDFAQWFRQHAAPRRVQ